MKKILIILIVFACCACSRGKYYVTNTFSEGITNIYYIDIDSSYRFYKREVYRDKDEDSLNVLRSNLSKTDTAKKIRIEVEYLLISLAHKNVIYITTVPDKFQQYYSKYILPDTVVNSYDFNTFQFGKLDADDELVTFFKPGNSKTITWQFRPVLKEGWPKQVFLRELVVEKKDMPVDVILVDKALQEQVSFTRQNSCNIIFNRPGTKEYGTALDICHLADNRIYFYKGKRGYSVVFKFDNSINGKDSAISFNYRRTTFDPSPLVSNTNPGTK
jgi:hypothetical protein